MRWKNTERNPIVWIAVNLKLFFFYWTVKTFFHLIWTFEVCLHKIKRDTCAALLVGEHLDVEIVWLEWGFPYFFCCRRLMIGFRRKLNQTLPCFISYKNEWLEKELNFLLCSKAFRPPQDYRHFNSLIKLLCFLQGRMTRKKETHLKYLKPENYSWGCALLVQMAFLVPVMWCCWWFSFSLQVNYRVEESRINTNFWTFSCLFACWVWLKEVELPCNLDCSYWVKKLIVKQEIFTAGWPL